MAKYTGTIAQLAGKVEINGNVLKQPELSVMTRIMEGIAFRKVGEIRNEGKRGLAQRTSGNWIRKHWSTFPSMTHPVWKPHKVHPHP